MKIKTSFRSMLIIFLLSLIKVTKLQTIEELIEPKCDGKTIKYSISAKIEEYLENENNIDGKDIYKSISDLYDKKLVIEKIKKIEIGNDFKDLKNLEEIEEMSLLDAIELANQITIHQIDGLILYNSFAESFQILTADLSIFPEKLFSVQLVFYVNKGKTELKNELNQFVSENKGLCDKLTLSWLDIGIEDKYLNLEELTGNKGTLKVAHRDDLYPLIYRHLNNEKIIIGAEVEFLYLFAKKNGYKLEFIETTKNEDLVSIVKNGTADFAIGFLTKKKDYEEDVDFTDPFKEEDINFVVRSDNLPESIGKPKGFTTIDEFNGEKLGILNGTMFDDITKNTFPNSEYTHVPFYNELIRFLLLKKIDGFAADELIIDYYHNLNIIPNLAFLPMNIEKSKNAFGFQKSENGEKLKNEFNTFLKTIDLKNLYKKWNVKSTFDLQVDKDLDTNGKIINVALDVDSKIVCFKEFGEIKGFEVEVLYKFLKSKGYNINLVESTLEESITLLEKGVVDIAGGDFTITEERKKKIDFSDPLYETGVVLITRNDCLKEKIPIKIIDNNYKTKSDNIANVQVKFNEIIKISKCAFPDKYNDTILINCTISDLEDINPSEGFEYVKTDDKIKVGSKTLGADNFFQANTKISGHSDIITEADKSNITCDSSSSSIFSNILVGVCAIILLSVVSLISLCF